MTRDEYIAWCKKRAIEEIEFSGKPQNGLNSILSDLRKHEETKDHAGIKLTVMLMIGGFLKNRNEVIKHINGFN